MPPKHEQAQVPDTKRTSQGKDKPWRQFITNTIETAARTFTSLSKSKNREEELLSEYWSLRRMREVSPLGHYDLQRCEEQLIIIYSRLSEKQKQEIMQHQGEQAGQPLPNGVNLEVGYSISTTPVDKPWQNGVASDYNGSLSEEAAIAAAIRASLVPDENGASSSRTIFPSTSSTSTRIMDAYYHVRGDSDRKGKERMCE